MNNQNPYFHENISQIPLKTLAEDIKTDLRYLCFDCGQSVKEKDPEFDYMCDRIVGELRSKYSSWELMYYDQACKNGMMDEYDKGQRITVKRLLTWLSCFDKSLRSLMIMRNESVKVQSDFDINKILQNGDRYPQIILFRLQHKPNYDAESWTLEEIEKTAEFKEWQKNRSGGKIDITKKIGGYAI